MATLTDHFFARFFEHRIVIAAILVVLLSYVGCQNDAPAGNFSRSRAARIKVNVFQPERTENATETFNFFGKLKASRSQTLGFPVGGNLTTAPEAQQRFASGATIATLDSTQLTEQLETLEQQVNTSSTTVSSNNPQYRSPQDQLRDQIAELENQVAQRTIKAPFDCIVESTFASQSSLVGANRPIVSVVEAKQPKIEIFLPREIVKLIENDRPYVFVLGGKDIEAGAGERAFTESPTGNIRMLFDIKTNLEDFEFYLNQSVEAKFSFPSEQSGHWLPLSCLQQASDGDWFVLVIESEGLKHSVRRRVVQIAQLRDDTVLVTNDLSEQLVVRDGVHRVVPGQRVELNSVEFDSVEFDADSDATDLDADFDADLNADLNATDLDSTP